MQNQPYILLWFKRDLRLTEHPALESAISLGLPIYPFFLWEPEWEKDPTTEERHLRFVWESIQSIKDTIVSNHGKFYLHRETAVSFFEKIFQTNPPKFLISHIEVGNNRTFQRDILVQTICKQYGVIWKEYKQQHIIRGLQSGRKDWSSNWKEWMLSPLSRLNPSSIIWKKESLSNEFIPKFTYNSNFQKGGEREGKIILDHFLENRVKRYSPCISKPEESRIHCSRLSPYLAWGNLSAKWVYQLTKKKQENSSPYIRKQMDRFLSRLFWRDHMMQKFESESRIETENFNRAFDQFVKEPNEKLIRLWEEGETGFPLVDACMKCLISTGYLNFRMRAMLVSFLTMIFWQDWRTGAKHLGRIFLDFEPGIHYFQFQMQAGTVGMHQLRIYNPYKQSIENDPNAIFIRKWLPEFKKTPIPEIHNWGKELSLFAIAKRPYPVVNLEQAIQKAKDTHFQFQKSLSVQKENRRIKNIHVN
jgi:deoxyribodipyrimidine photo-lyase